MELLINIVKWVALIVGIGVIIPLVVTLPIMFGWTYVSKRTPFGLWHERNKVTLGKILGVAALLFVAWWFLIGSARGSQWSGDGTINVFPQADSAKNYRLDAIINVTIKGEGLFKNYQEYLIQQATWPNGGTIEFDKNCTPSQLTPRQLCTASNGQQYYIEVNDAPSND